MAEKQPASKQLKHMLTWLLPNPNAKRSAQRLKRSKKASSTKKKPVLGGDNKFNVIVDPSLPDDEKSGKQKLRESRADQGSYVLDEGIYFGDYDLILYGLGGLSDAHVQFEEMQKGRQSAADPKPIQALIRRRFCSMCARMGLLSLVEHEAHIAVILLRETKKFTPSYLRRVHRILLQGQGIHPLWTELKEYLPEIELGYNQVLGQLTHKSRSAFSNPAERIHFAQHIAPVFALSWALVHKKQEEKEENEHVCP